MNLFKMLRICFILNVVISVTYSAFIIDLKNSNYCYAVDKNAYKYVATKTAYEFVHGDTFYGKIPKCEPIQFWSINRHGTRLPDKSAIKELQKLTELQKSILKNYESATKNSEFPSLCDEDIQLFKNWKWNTSINENISTTLTIQGWQDEKLMALRNKARFSNLLAIPYSEQDFLFRHTDTQRTEASCKAYAEGLFGTDSDKINFIVFKNDTLLETYKHCKFWQETVDENPDSLIEYNKFLNSDIYQNLISDVSKRLGFTQTLNQSTIENIYDMCRFEQAWNVDDKSAWCASFTREHLEILEYAEDLLYWYLIGHGIELNAKVGCMPLKDMFEQFENIIDNGTSGPKGIFYFTHSSSLQLLMVAMGMNKDKIPLTGDNMNEQSDRKWRTSLIGPFAANIDAILYKCTEGDEYRISFYLNEKLYVFPECPDGTCSWEVVKQKFEKTAQNCSLDFCNNNDSIYRVKH